MFYQKIPPNPTLSSSVECYYVWENDEPVKETLIVESPPSAFSAIVFSYADDYFVAYKNQPLQFVPRQFIVGQLTRSYALHFPERIGTAAIVFKPTWAASIFNISMYAYTEERTDLKAVLPSTKVETAVQGIQSTTDAGTKAKYLEQFVLHHYKLNRPVPNVIDMAANQIVEKYGQVNINELCSEYAISRRQFERKFLQKVGLSPSYYARLRRLGGICLSIAGKKEVNWQDLYFQSDYYTSPTLLKILRSLPVGHPPST